MSPIRRFFSDDSKHTALLVAFWAIIFICVIISSTSLIVGHRATNTADRSEDGFCIAIQLIEGGAVADARIANSPGVSSDVKQIRTQQYMGSLHFALKLRHLGFHCAPPSFEVIQLVKRKASP